METKSFVEEIPDESLCNGATGYIGGSITKVLVDQGYTVLGLVRNDNKLMHCVMEITSDQIINMDK